MLTTPIQAIDQTPDQWRHSTFSSLGNYKTLAERPWSQLRHFEIFPGTFLHSTPWVVPMTWLPPGSMHRPSARTINPSDASSHSDPDIARQLDENIRRALLALWLPGLISVRYRASTPSTWLNYSQRLIDLARWQLNHGEADNGSLFGTITLSKLHTHILPSIAKSEGRRDRTLRTVRKLIDAGKRGVISDWPRQLDLAETVSVTATVEDVVLGAPDIPTTQKTPDVNWPPFSDDFVTHFFQRAIWIIDNIAEDTYRLWLNLRAMPDKLGKSIRDVTSLRAKTIAGFEWTDVDGAPLTQLPFALHYYDGMTSEWPPRDMQSFNRVVSLVQCSIAALVGLCTGARSSEILGAEDTSLQLAHDRFHSRIFKFSGVRGGKRFDWPLHPIAVRGVQIQQQLARAIRPEHTAHLWTKLKNLDDVGTPTFNLSAAMLGAVKFLGLEELTDEKSPHFHRLRHTLARLIALTLVHAPQVVQDIFDHKDLEQTCTYLCSDPEIVEEALKVADEMSFAIAEEAVRDTLSNDTSGPAADRVRQGLASVVARRGETEFATKDLPETVQVLTFDNKTWRLVRPGILCTKAIGEFGPCTRGRGAPDPGSCRIWCDHRLETASARADCQDALQWLIEERKHAIESREEMLVARLDGEICSHLARWTDVREAILSDHPELTAVWSGRTIRSPDLPSRPPGSKHVT